MMSKVRIDLPREKIAGFCKRNHIRRLSLFGSALQGDVRPDSDIDFLVEFYLDHVPGLIKLAGMEIELAELLDLAVGHPGIGLHATPGEAPSLPLAGGEDLLADLVAQLPPASVPQFAVRHAGDLDVDVDAVEQGAADAGHVGTDLVGRAAARPRGVAEVAAGAPVRSEFKKILTRKARTSLETTRPSGAA